MADIQKILKKIAAEYDGRVYEHASPHPDIADEPRHGGAFKINRADVEHELFDYAGKSEAENARDLSTLNNYRSRARLRVAEKRAPKLYPSIYKRYSGEYDPKRGLPPAVISYDPNDRFGDNKLYDDGDYTIQSDGGESHFTSARADIPTTSAEPPYKRTYSEFAVIPESKYHEGLHWMTTPTIQYNPIRDMLTLPRLKTFGRRIKEFGVPGDEVGNKLDLDRIQRYFKYSERTGSASEEEAERARQGLNEIYSKTTAPEHFRNYAGIKYALHKQFGELALTQDAAIDILKKHGLIEPHEDDEGFGLTRAGRAWNSPANDNVQNPGGESYQRNEIDRFVREYNAVQRAKKYIEQAKQHPESVDPEKLKRAQEFVEQSTDDYEISNARTTPGVTWAAPYVSPQITG